MRAALVAIALVSGCGFAPSSATPSDGGDASIDALKMPPDGCISATDQFDTCLLGAGSDLTITDDATYDTDSGVLEIDAMTIATTDMQLATSTGTIDVLIVGNFNLEAKLTASGSLPFAIYASGLVTINANLTVANGGAGARTSCPAGPVNGGDSANGAGGAGGGAFLGNGGSGETGNNGGTPGGAGGTSEALPTGLLGGCPGATGGQNGGGTGGAGGGAVLIATPSTIAVMSKGGIDAGGAGGNQGTKTAQGGGGGGGGSGGLILLQASSISVASGGFVVANGGGGGEGASNTQNGNPGDNGHKDATAASGGSGTTDGGNGGDGGAVSTTLDGASATQSTSDGGGGGGGGVGFIAIRGGGVSNAGVFSPTPIPWP